MLHELFLIYLTVINLCSLIMMLSDKIMARRHARRIPESTLILSGILGGSVGALLGMYLFRHKTRHRKFTIGMPLILVLQAAAAAVLKFAL